MTTNFNIYPYFDDFEENAKNKNYHKILFKPGTAVQARELTQTQSVLQDQIKLFGNHIFQNHTPVSGGQITTNFRVRYLKLQLLDLNNEEIVASNFLNKVISNQNLTTQAKVISTVEKITDSSGTVISPPI